MKQLTHHRRRARQRWALAIDSLADVASLAAAAAAWGQGQGQGQGQTCRIDPATGEVVCQQGATQRVPGREQVAGAAEFRTANFSVRSAASSPELPQQVAEWCEYFRRVHWQDWIGTDPPAAWAEPAKIELVPANDSSAATGIFIDGGQWIGVDARWNVTEAWASTVVPHEVMHIVLHNALGYHPPRWLDEGIAVNCESPAEQRNYWPMAYELAMTGQAQSLRQLTPATPEPTDATVVDYAMGTTLVAMLLEEPAGRQGVVQLAVRIRDRGLDDACYQCYKKSPEELDAQWRAWMRSQTAGPSSEKRIGGAYYVFCREQRRWVPGSTGRPMAAVQSAPQQPRPLIPSAWKTAVDARLERLETQGSIPTATPTATPTIVAGQYVPRAEFDAKVIEFQRAAVVIQDGLLKKIETATAGLVPRKDLDALKIGVLDDLKSLNRHVAERTKQAGELLDQVKRLDLAPATTVAGGLLSGLSGGDLAGLLASGLLLGTGVTAPYAAWRLGAWAVGSLARRRIGNRLARSREQGAGSQPQPVVVSDGAPLPQQVVQQTNFVPYEVDSFAAADADAQREYVRKYPGAVTTLEGFKGMRNQFYQARTKK